MSLTAKQFNDVFNAGSTGLYTTILNDHLNQPIPLADIVSLTLTLTQIDKPATGPEIIGAIVNNREDQDVLNANNVTVHTTSGLLSFFIQSLDTAIIDATKLYETHRATFQCTYNTANKLTWDADFLIRKLVG